MSSSIEFFDRAKLAKLTILGSAFKVFNSKEVGEVKEGADRYSAKKLSKHCKG